MHPRRRLTYSVPLAAVALTAGIVALPSPASGSPHPVLPARSAEQLVAAALAAQVDHFSGTVVTVASLGLPSLPDASRGVAGGLSGLTGLVTGKHTLYVSYGGPDQQRVAVLEALAERDVIRNGTNLWTYDSITGDVTHATLPAGHEGRAMSTEPTVTPPAAARQLLAHIDPTTSVSVDRTARVAGRSAYQIVLQPRQAGVLVRSVRIALDARTSLPLRLQVFGAGSKPAVQIGFTHISFGAPKASTFAFTPPPGSHLGSGVRARAKAVESPESAPMDSHAATAGSPHVLGTGWAAIVELPATALAGDSAAMFKELSVAAPGGGRILRTSLLTVLRAADGRIFIGAVTPQFLEHAAGQAG